MPKKDDPKDVERRQFFAIVHDELAWARKLLNRLAPLYDEGFLDAVPPERIKSQEELQPPHEERIVKDPRGHVMSCIMCGKAETVDGRFCSQHWEPGDSDLSSY